MRAETRCVLVQRGVLVRKRVELTINARGLQRSFQTELLAPVRRRPIERRLPGRLGNNDVLAGLDHPEHRLLQVQVALDGRLDQLRQQRVVEPASPTRVGIGRLADVPVVRLGIPP